MNVAILTSKNQWFVPYAEELSTKIAGSCVFFDHKEIKADFDVLFILSYHQIIESKYLENNKHNIVVHASALPEGKGWAPMFWQILNGQNKIPFSMFEVSDGVDNGDVYMLRTLELDGGELNVELREKQAAFTIEMCLEFITSYEEYETPKKQSGAETFYTKRKAADSKLDIHKTIEEQFNLLRIVNNDEYPAFFEKNNRTYILKIEEVKK